MNKESYYSFLTYGYFLDYKPKLRLDFSAVDKSRYNNWAEKDLIKLGIATFRESINKNFKANNEHVVPLSGGLDSRAILAFLKEFTELSKIHTYTFGTPGTYDYEIGNMVANRFKTKHAAFPLTDHKYTLEEEIEISRQIDHQTYLFHHPPIFKLLQKYGGKVLWSGYIGDWISGKHAPKVKNEMPEDVIKNYCKKRRMGKNFNFPASNEVFLENLFEFTPYHDPANVSYEEQVEAQNFLIKCTAPHILYNSFEYKTPHIDQNWIAFMMSSPDELRHGENLFKKILYHYDKVMFSLPVKGNHGLKLIPNKLELLIQDILHKGYHYSNKLIGFPKSRSINYIDFREAIRKRKDFKQIIYSSVNDLMQRKILEEIPITLFWERHQKGIKDYSNELILLASLEIHLKAGKIL